MDYEAGDLSGYGGILRTIAERVVPQSMLVSAPFVPLSRAEAPAAQLEAARQGGLAELVKQGENLLEAENLDQATQRIISGIETAVDLPELQETLDSVSGLLEGKLPDLGKLATNIQGLTDYTRYQDIPSDLQQALGSVTGLLDGKLPDLGKWATDIQGLTEAIPYQEILPEIKGALEPFSGLLEDLPGKLTGAGRAAGDGGWLQQAADVAVPVLGALTGKEQGQGSLLDQGISWAGNALMDKAGGLLSGSGAESFAGAGKNAVQTLFSSFDGGGLLNKFLGKRDPSAGASQQPAPTPARSASAPSAGGATAGQAAEKKKPATETQPPAKPRAAQDQSPAGASAAPRSEQILLSIEQRLAEIASLLGQAGSPAAAQPGEASSAGALRPLAEELGRLAREAAWIEHERRGWY